jgi:hypothetical protein
MPGFHTWEHLGRPSTSVRSGPGSWGGATTRLAAFGCMRAVALCPASSRLQESDDHLHCHCASWPHKGHNDATCNRKVFAFAHRIFAFAHRRPNLIVGLFVDAHRIGFALLLGVAGCGVQRSAEPRDLPSGEPIGAYDTDSKADSASGAPDDGDDDPGSSGLPDPIFDVGTPDGDDAGSGCRAVDFLFVIDNSGSMSPHQRNLVDNFPAFIGGIEATLEDVDSFHVGVVTSDDYEYNPPGCDTIGGLVTRTGGNHSSDKESGPFAEGRNFMTEADPIEDLFADVAMVGTSGDHRERPMEALLRAVDGSLSGPDQCNEGFLRDEALLVAVIITDEADGPGDPEHEFHGYPISPGTPSDWFESVVDAKGGHPENAVVLSLVHYEGGPCPPPNGFADPAFFDGQNMVDFADEFGDNGFRAGICSDYAAAFSQAVSVVAAACDNFVPAG